MAGIVMTALLLEFLALDGTVGISLPFDRHSALSTVAIQVQGTEPEPHYVTRNYRFSVVEENPNEPVVIREFSFNPIERDRPIPPSQSKR